MQVSGQTFCATYVVAALSLLMLRLADLLTMTFGGFQAWPFLIHQKYFGVKPAYLHVPSIKDWATFQCC